MERSAHGGRAGSGAVLATVLASACILGVAGSALADRRTAAASRDQAIARVTAVATTLSTADGGRADGPDGPDGADGAAGGPVAGLASRPGVRSVLLVSSDGVVEDAAVPARYPAVDTYAVGDVVPAPVLEDVLAAVRGRAGVRATPADAGAPSGLLTLAVPLRRDGRAAVLHVVLDTPRPGPRALPLDGGPAGGPLRAAAPVLLLGLAALGYRVRSRRRSQSVRALQPRSALDGDLEAAVGRTRTGSDPLTLVLLQAPGLGRARGPLSRLVVQRRVGVVAAALARELPGPAYRIGADAFAVLLPGTGLPEAAVRVERVALLLERGLRPPVRAGMSSRAGTGTPTRAAEADGVVLLTSADQRPGRGEPDALFLPSEPDAALVRADADALLIRADAALHEAWSLGNGQVVVAAGAGRTPLPDDGPAASRAA